MFGLLNSSQIYGLQQTHDKSNLTTAYEPTRASHSSALAAAGTSSHALKHRRSASNASDAGKEGRLLATAAAAASSLGRASPGGMKSPTNFIEKFIKSELLNGYDTIRNYKNFHHSAKQAPGLASGSPHAAGVISSFSCLHGSYRSNVEGEFYEAVNVGVGVNEASSEMPSAKRQSPSLQSYQKLSDSEADLPPSLFPSSGASSGEFNSNSSDSTTTTTQTATNNHSNSNNKGSNSNGHSNRNSLFKKMQNGSKARKSLDMTNGNTNEITSDNSSSSISTTTNSSGSSSSQTSAKSSELQRSSSSASSGVAGGPKTKPKPGSGASADSATPAEGVGGERSQRRKLMQMISNYDQQNKLLQRELAKEKRRRSEELAVVVKSLLCFESKLKTDMKAVNQRLQEKDAEICRLVRQNRALRKRLQKAREAEGENTRDEGVGVEEDGAIDGDANTDADRRQLDAEALADEDCLVLEALQCINCRKQFYDIDSKEGWTQTQAKGKDGGRANGGHTTELGSSSDDTVSSSFYGARRSVRYTSKRTSGTFRDYMRSRSMHIDDDEEDDDAQLDNNSEGNTSSISRDDSRRSYEKMNLYSRTIERMHGVKSTGGSGGGSSDGGNRSASRASSKSSGSSSAKSAAAIEEDDGIFSPTQDEDFEEDDLGEEDDGLEEELEESYKVTKRRSMEFSEASPKQVYEVSTDDWYASASDQEDAAAAPKSYGQNAVNPVLECVNQILLQQSMEEPLHDEAQTPRRQSLEAPAQAKGTPKPPHHLSVSSSSPANLPRRSSLSGRRSSRSNSHSSDGHSRSGTLTRKRVHFSTKNSMVHVPRNDDHDEDEQLPGSVQGGLDDGEPPYHPMNYYQAQLKPPAVAVSAAAAAAASSMAGPTAAPPSVIYAAQQREEHERLETLNYESIYSNEYEPIGSEHNSSNLYVDMESTSKSPEGRGADAKLLKGPLSMPLPPALPPKPANLLKFKKSLQQLDEMPDEHLQQEDCGASTTTATSTTGSEPDYCSISEVNVAVGRVQIVADVHKAPESEPDLELEPAPASELDLEVSTVASVRSDDTCAESHKTDEIEEIFADIPKLPNVAAIIGPKSAPKFPQPPSDHYLLMSPKAETPSQKLQSALQLTLNATDAAAASDFLLGSPSALKSPAKAEPTPLLGSEGRQFKRKHVPNILVEINKRMHNPSAPSSPSTPTGKAALPSPKKPSSVLSSPQAQATSLPLLQAEFDWYNLDAEYGKAPTLGPGSSSLASGATHTPDILKVAENMGPGSMLEEIHEDRESVVAGADEYNLDEEFSLTCDRPDLVLGEQPETGAVVEGRPQMEACLSAICEAVNFPLFGESSPQPPSPPTTKASAKKMRKNLANFEKFIEGSGLSTKTLPSKRKIYFAGPFV